MKLQRSGSVYIITYNGVTIAEVSTFQEALELITTINQ